MLALEEKIGTVFISRNEHTRVVPGKQAALLGVVVIVLSMATGAYTVRSADADAFSKGGGRTSIIGGWGQAFNDDYFILGVGAGYYMIDGLEIGMELETWLGGGPGIHKISPEVRYVLYPAPSLKPYAGAFYRRTIIERFDDIDSVGFRAGAFHDTGNGSYFGVGVVHEIFLNCDKDVYSSCTETYPEIVFWLAF